ncbi:heterokaryon incompatibility protein-domain-containing protein [Hyaloscypha finlandica]|nr:heterokaryon incompatibility protein-domain-containing protein [Hyaloscypha finlandica]
MDTSSSLVVKLPVRVCNTCIDVLSQWFKPTSQRYEPGYEDLGSTWLVREERFENRSNDPRWGWKVRSLKNAAQKCVFCRSLLKCLDSSPWIPYEDDDYVELESRFVGSTHTILHDREIEDNQAQWKRVPFRSHYERFCRPRLQLFKKKVCDEGRRYTSDEYMFILPQPRFGKDQEVVRIAQAFQGRIVDKNVDFSLVHQWFTTCKSNHVKSKIPVTNHWGSIEGRDCQPTPTALIPHFRLVDARERCVVIPEDPDPEYAALSYVWGSSKRLLLRSDNLTKLSTQGVLSQGNEELPNTFRDAIAVIEQLGIRYLWIDAICILQDNEQQLAEHMNSMDSIYGSALLTIVSDTSGANCGIHGIGYHHSLTKRYFNVVTNPSLVPSAHSARH